MVWFLYSLLSVVLLLIFLITIGYGTLIKPYDMILYFGIFALGFVLHSLSLIPNTFIATIYTLVTAAILYVRTRNLFLSVLLAAINYSVGLLIWYATFGLYHFVYPENSLPIYLYLHVPPAIFALFAVIEIVVFLGMALVIRRLDAKYNIIQILELGYQKFYWLSFFIFSGVVATGLFHIYAYAHKDYQIYTVISFFSYVVLLLLSVIFVILIIKTNTQTAYLAEKSSYAMQLEEENQNMQYFRHDYKNILLTMSIFMEKNDMEGLKRYFYEDLKLHSNEELYLAPLHKDLQNLEILPLKGVIMEKIKRAEELDIAVSVQIPTPIQHVNMPIIKLVRCLSILMDNALEESKLVDTPEITIELQQQKADLAIKIANKKHTPKTVPVGNLVRKGYTTKGEGRGKGLASLTRLINTTKNASYTIQQDTDTFTCFIFLQD